MLGLFLKIQENIGILILKRRLQNLYKKENFKLEIKQKNTSKLSSKYLIDRICKIKQYLSYINLWYKSQYSSSPKDILKSEKKNLWKTLHQGDNF